MSPSSGTAKGSISTQNLNPASGVATPLSAVELDLGGKYNTAAIQVVGTYTGALTAQCTIDGENWEDIAGTVVGNSLVNVATGAAAANIASATQDVFRLPVAGYAKVRITAKAAMTGAAAVTLLATN